MEILDVKSLFTNVTVDFTIDTIDLILNNIFRYGVKDFNGLKKQQLKKLLFWTCKGTIFQFNNNIYEQIDGILMGNPIAPLMADVYINWVLEQISVFNTQPHVILRFVDDLFCVLTVKLNMNCFLLKLMQFIVISNSQKT